VHSPIRKLYVQTYTPPMQGDLDGEPLRYQEVLAKQPYLETADEQDAAEGLLADMQSQVEEPQDDKLQDPDTEVGQLIQSLAKEPLFQNGQSQELEGPLSLSSTLALDAELGQLIQPPANEPQHDKLQEFERLIKGLSSSQDQHAELDQLIQPQAKEPPKDDGLQELEGLIKGLPGSQDPNAELGQLIQSQAKEPPKDDKLQGLEGLLSLSSSQDLNAELDQQAKEPQDDQLQELEGLWSSQYHDAELDQLLANSPAKDTQDDQMQELQGLLSLGSQCSIPKPAAQKELYPLLSSTESQDDKLQELQGILNLAMGLPEEPQEDPRRAAEELLIDKQATIEILNETWTNNSQEDPDKLFESQSVLCGESQGADGRTDTMAELKKMLHSQLSMDYSMDGYSMDGPAHNTTPASLSTCGDTELAQLLLDNNNDAKGSEELIEIVSSTPSSPKATGELGDASWQSFDSLDALEDDIAKIMDDEHSGGEIEADHTNQCDHPSVRDEHTAEKFMNMDIIDVGDEDTQQPTEAKFEMLRELISLRAKKAEEKLVPVEKMEKQVQQSMGLIAANGPPVTPVEVWCGQVNPAEIWWKVQELLHEPEKNTCMHNEPATKATCLQCTLSPPMCENCLSKPQSSKTQEAGGYV